MLKSATNSNTCPDLSYLSCFPPCVADGPEPPPAGAAKVACPKFAENFSHQRPTVMKSAVVFPASRVMVLVELSAVDASVICLFEIRKPSDREEVALPHQYKAGAEASASL